MRATRLLAIALTLLVSATTAFGAVITIRTGQVGGSPGSCGGADDNFRYYAPNQNCGQPILGAAFTAADFAQACQGPQATVISPAGLPWIQGLNCDPDARWINSHIIPGSCLGNPESALYCASFGAADGCAVADSIRICWGVDDFLGDPPAFPGPNPGGVYVNGNDLGPAFSGPGFGSEFTAVAYNVPLLAGTNTLHVYQRDAACAVSGLIMSVKIYTGCGSVGTENKPWGSIKKIYR